MNGRSRRWLAASAAAVVLAGAAGGAAIWVNRDGRPAERTTSVAGQEPEQLASERGDTTTSTGLANASIDPPRYDGYPGDLLTLTNYGTNTYTFGYEDYEQMRDYHDLVILGTLMSFDVESPITDAILPGRLVARFRIDHIIGGQRQPMQQNGLVEIALSLDGDAETTATVLGRIEPMLGKAQYLLFLNRAMPGPNDEPRYAFSIDNGPSGILALWPGDGRLSLIQGRNDLAFEAIERGEQKTGLKDSVVLPEVPRFEGQAPIGLTVPQLLDQFARPTGTTETPAPKGWAEEQRYIDSVLGE